MRFSPALIFGILLAQSAAAAPRLAFDAVNQAPFAPLPEPASAQISAEVLRAEVLLDRARFSPGPIDGINGDNFRKAIAAYQGQAGLMVSGHLDQATWDKLTAADPDPVLVRRPLRTQDLKGPFTAHIPSGFEAQSKLKRLEYRNVRELLSEQTHASPRLLAALNPRTSWRKPGTLLTVPQVVSDKPVVEAARLTVDKPGHAVKAFGSDGKLLAFYPASIGSDEKPAPTGQFVIRRVIHNPDYTYNPKYAFKGVKSRKPFRIAPGPNNPVGPVWLDLSYEGYGIHGTPDPDRVGKTQSHGCIRLTNWTAEDLASMVRAGTPVTFQDGPAVPTQPTGPQPAPMPNVPASAVP